MSTLDYTFKLYVKLYATRRLSVMVRPQNPDYHYVCHLVVPGQSFGMTIAHQPLLGNYFLL